MNSAAASNAFAKWETLEPAATSSSTKTERVSLAAPSLQPKLPSSQHQLQPPPTPNVLTGHGIDDSFVAAGGGFPRSPPLSREEPRPSKPIVAAAAVFAGSDSTRGERYAVDSGGSNGTIDYDGKERNTSPAGLAPFGTVDADTPARAHAALATAASGPQSLPQPQAPRALPTSRGGRNQDSEPSFWGERARPSDGGGKGGGGGGGGVAKDGDAEALLARLAGKAKQAAAVALSASAASGGMTPDPTARAAPTRRVTRNVKSSGVESITDATVRVRFSGDKGHLGAAIKRGTNGEECRDESTATAVGRQVPEVVAAAAAGGVAVDGGARLAELCKEDKTKVARLMQDLVKLRQEKESQKTRFERLRAQNDEIVKEMAGLKVKFGQSMQLLRKYQSIVQEGE
ncbi:unnamed protein product, partial [Ectocarpus sp. 13 AM-2016]